MKPPEFLPGRASLPHIIGSAAPSRVARPPNTGVTSYDRHSPLAVRASNSMCHLFAVPRRATPAMKACGPNDHGLGRKAVSQGLHDSRLRTWLVACLEAGPRRTAEKAGGGIIESPTRPPCARPPASLLGAAGPLLALPADYVLSLRVRAALRR
ncbi:hypothetical protein C8F04DRAFT_1155301 [Mycena alexandri]|uniref:Uncharacterized protein n=1 Tax=Mycena alexandri TaxID=1745969 RepID=A0AAD6RZS3_9AGAR|nr:hypothetical protein C8F04DRAFT_1155301 [Mycena alexandri]